ncbi:MAG: GtrA family protein [Galactobacter sp.]
MANLYRRLRALVSMLWREVAKFGVVGTFGWIIDTGLYLYLMNGPLHQGEVWAKGWGSIVAALFTWVANRFWTFRDRRQGNVVREFFLFVVMNVIGLLIATGCVAFTKYILEMNSQWAMFVSGSIVGLVLGTIFRYLAYKYWVFTGDVGKGAKPKSVPHHRGGAREQALGVAQELEGAAGFDPRRPLNDEAVERYLDSRPDEADGWDLDGDADRTR